MEKLYLLDAYALIYRAYYALIRSPRINSKGFNTSAVFGFVNTLEEIIHKYHPTHLGVAFDPAGPTFRHKAFPQYKAQRESTPEDIKASVPVIKNIIRAYNIPIIEVPGYEADDVIGTLSALAEAKGMETFMVTPDKDYGQLVTDSVFQLKPGTSGFQLYGPDEIDNKYGIDHTRQVIDILGLMGDTADNVPGCPGVGEKTAAKLIKNFGSIEGIYEHIDQLKGKQRENLENNKEQVLFSKYLVTIRKDVPLEFEPEKLKVEEPNREELARIFEDLEFRTLLRKICGTGVDEETVKNQSATGAPAPASGGGGKTQNGGPKQLDLFATEPDESSERPNPAIFKAETFDDATYKAIETENERQRLIEKILTNHKVAFSISTTTLAGIDAEIVGMAFALAAGEVFFVNCEGADRASDEIVKEFKPVFASPDVEKSGHDLKFSMLALNRYGIRMEGPLFDTMLAHYLIQPELNHGLDYISIIYLHHPGTALENYFGTKWQTERDMRLLPDEVREHFECERADMVWRLEPRLKSEMERLSAEQLFDDIEVPLTSVLATMEENGVVLDVKSLQETSKLFKERMNTYENEVYSMAGQRFNLSSPKQVGEVLFGQMQLLEKPKKTKSGQYVTSESVLEELRPKYPVVDYLLKYRGMKKLVSTYIDALPKLINPRTGHIHTTFNQAVTATGRLSSSNPNLQNIPVRGDDGKEIRKAFIPEPGCEFFSADYSQIELRIMAHLSQDEHMIAAFRNGYDIHAATAAKIYHKDIADVTSDERRKAKTANFGIIYGITVFGLSQRIGISRGEAKDLIDSYFKNFTGVRRYMDQSIEEARRKGYIETIFHRRRYLPDINSGNAVVRGYAERNAINAPIQGSAADIIKVAMVNIDRRFRKEGIRSKMILQVHDELNFSVFPDEKAKVESIVKTEMENAYQMSVPLIADCGWGSNWLEAH
jgi:DNA polymerase-1